MNNLKNLSFAVALSALTLAGCGGSGGGSNSPAIPELTFFILMQPENGDSVQLHKFTSSNHQPVAITNDVDSIRSATPNGPGDKLFFAAAGTLKSIAQDGSNPQTHQFIGGAEHLSMNYAGTRILFSDTDGGLWKADWNGANKTILVPDIPTSNWNAQFSNSGDKVFFNAYDSVSQMSDIFSVNYDGTQKTNLTADFAEGTANPCASPDTEKIAFATASGIYEMDQDGQNKRFVTGADEPERLTYSPDGQWLAWSESNNTREVWIAKIDGTYKKKILSSDAQMLRLVGVKFP